MADTNDIKSTQDFEMGDDDNKSQPKINNYNQGATSMPSPDLKKVDPKASPPPITPKTQASKAPIDPVKKKKAALGCLSAFGAIMLIFIIISFIFLAQDSANNPIAQLLGINQGSFTNGLITFIHILFIITALTEFVYTMIGIFRASMAKKEDKIAKKAGLRTALTAGIFFMITIVIWMFAFLYLDSKRVATGDEIIPDSFITEPEETFNLTAPVEITFDAQKLPISKSQYRIISYAWDFDDGTTGNKPVEIHIFKDKGEDQDGRYDVLLTVTVEDKKTGEEAEFDFGAKVTIADVALSAIIKADVQSGEAPLKVEFDASESFDPDSEINRYEWDFDGDEEYDEEGEEVTHTFEKDGDYTVYLRVSTEDGDFSIAEKQIIVSEDELPKAVIEIGNEPENYETGIQYIFKAGESTSPNGDIDKYEWDFDDGTRAEKSKNVTHKFENEGKYEVSLTVTDEDGKEGVATKEIVIGAPQGTPEASITTIPAMASGALSLEGKVPFTVKFDASDSTDSDDNITDYNWDFDDNGSGAVGATASHTFSEVGNYNVSLELIDSDGNKDSKSISIKVTEQGINAALKTDKAEGNVPLSVRFDASGSTFDKGNITSYKWDFGDGTKPKLGSATIKHKYTEIGTYTATVTVIGSDNSQSSTSVLVTVREIPLSACFDAVFETGKAPLTNSFDPGCSSGTVSSYFWNFGDGSTSTQVKPTHTYTSPGDYTVTLEITDSDNTVDDQSMNIKITE